MADKEILARRIVRPVPMKGIEPVPAGAMLVDGQLDYLDDGKSPEPDDAVYVAYMDKYGAVEVVKGELVDAVHTFAGWPLK